MQKHEEWLEFAYEDLKLAKIALLPQYMVVRGALYHAQQATEKALKAFLVFNEIVPPRTHDVTGLLKKCAKFDPDFMLHASDAFDINPFSVSTRYPDDAYVFPDPNYSQLILDKADKIVDFVRYKIKHTG